MTISDFRFWESEVIDVVDNLLDKVKRVSFSDYVLLLSRAGYQMENENTFLSPFVIQSNLELIQDESRRRFLHTYLNQYTYCLKENIFYEEEMTEYNINMQLMLYSHVWESRCLLMTLKRIVGILSGKGYIWKIPFERPQRKDNKKMIPINKGKFIREEIIEPLIRIDNKLYAFLTSIYNSTIRNGYFHSMYQIDMNKGDIDVLNSDSYKIETSISFFDWEAIFCKSVLFSYHLINKITERLNHFTIDYPNLTEVLIVWPSFKEPGINYTKSIYPIELECGDKTYVAFQFSPIK